MKAAILVEQKKPLIIDEVELPSNLKYGQALVKISYSGVCGSQIGEIDGAKGVDKYLPHLLGHEGSGIVQEIGEGVTQVAPGDHVVLHWKTGVGIQSATPKYRWQGNNLNAGWVTTFNEMSVVSENRLTKIPRNFDLKKAALYGCAITTGFGIINNNAKCKIGESVAIWGAGGLGMATILGASLAGANPIVAIDVQDNKLDMAKRFGASHVINSSRENVKNRIHDLLPEGIDKAVDCTGIKEVRETAYELTSKVGTLVLAGVPKTPGEKINIESLPLHFSKTITGSFGGESNPSYDIPRFINLEKSGAFDLNEMISKTYSLDDINEAIQAVRLGQVMRVIVEMK